MIELDTWRAVRRSMEESVFHKLVTPVAPVGRSPSAYDDVQAPSPGPRDHTSSWSLYISYEDVNGEQSERRITCKSIDRALGGTMTVGAFCHERGAHRAFRLDRMREVVDISTGEVVDPDAHFEMLALQGLPLADKGMATFAKMLVFMTHCDGEAHAAEWAAIERALERYALKFGGDDASLEAALRTCRGVSPDGRDFTSYLGKVARTPTDLRKQVVRLVIDSCGQIIDADGRHADEELDWSLAVSSALQKLA